MTPPYHLNGLVAELRALAPEEIDLGRVSNLISRAVIDDEDLAPYLNFQPGRYTRNLVARFEHFDVIVLCWSPGQRTPIHDHDDQLGWVRVLRGTLEETTYEIQLLASAAGEPIVDQRVTCHRTLPASEGTVTVDEVRAVHRLASGAEQSVSLHVYSKPHDVCRVYDEETGAMSRSELTFDRMPVE